MDNKNKVLIADDDVFILNLLEKILVRMGCDPVRACNGREAIERLDEETDVKCAVSDICMPEKNGFELLEYILNRSHQVPVILTSSQPFTTREILHRGAKAFLRKPFRIGEMQEEILRIIENGAKSSERRRESRVPIRLPVTIDSYPGESVSGWSYDLSRSGICFSISEDGSLLPPAFSLLLKIDNRRVVIDDTRKIWERKEDNGRWLIGCRLGNTDESDRRMLESALVSVNPC